MRARESHPAPRVLPALALLVAGMLSVAVTGLAGEPENAGESEIPRRPDGKPDLSGTYDVATLTPLSRPGRFAEKATFTEEEAKQFAAYWLGNLAKDSEPSDPNRAAPPEGGTEVAVPEFSGAAGGVGGYNAFYVDIGESAFKLDGEYRTSIIVDPPNGRMPPMTPEARAERAEQGKLRRENDGTAWWLDLDLEVGPYDDPEIRGVGERCLLGFGSTGGPPMLPVMYNNMKRIVQTDDTVMILAEMNHDARVVRLDSEHVPPELRFWMGDSIGWWEGDTLVVETTNFRDETGFGAGSRNMKVTERFSRIDGDTLRYRFTVEDPTVWTEPWTGEYPWPETDDRVYEYACHEGNYSLGGILRGARLLEREAEAAKSGGPTDSQD
ncbi:MAG TPA: hypothetical protein VMT85_10085 [Thermoanaerobaculia bacterium]|nr:hypothetical protein [Thermoanaerobaculia bacterium]